jgi:hypothetical protein
MKTSSRPLETPFNQGRPSVGGSRIFEESEDDIAFLPIADRPQRREECRDGPRPCPLVGCPHNTFLNVTSTGRIQLAHGKRQPEDVPPHESCSLDVADSGAQTLSRVGEIMGLTRERIRQIETKILEKIRKNIEQNRSDLGAWEND